MKAKVEPLSRKTYYAHIDFRSSLEARWAIFFDHLCLRWKYEPRRFELLTTSYLPDFWLRMYDHTEIWFEVKGPSPAGHELNAARELATETRTPVIVAVGDDALDCNANLRMFTPGGRQLLVRWHLTTGPNGPHLSFITPNAISAAGSIHLSGCHARELQQAATAATTHQFRQRRPAPALATDSGHDCRHHQPTMDHGDSWNVGDLWRCPACHRAHRVALGTGGHLYMSRYMDTLGSRAA